MQQKEHQCGKKIVKSDRNASKKKDVCLGIEEYFEFLHNDPPSVVAYVGTLHGGLSSALGEY